MSMFSDITISELILGVVGTLLTIFGILLQKQLVKIKNKLSPEEKEPEKPEQIGISLMMDKTISDVVAETRVKADASRAYVIRFHNGHFFTSKQPVWKMSCTQESCAIGIEYFSLQIQNIPATGMLDILVPFWGKQMQGTQRIDPTIKDDGSASDPREGVYKTSVDDLPEGVTKQELLRQGIVDLILTPLISPESGRVVGLIGLDFCFKGSYKSELNHAYTALLKSSAARVTFLFMRENMSQEKNAEKTEGSEE